MTKNQRSLDSAVMMSSLMPSEKYSCSGSPLMLVNGKHGDRWPVGRRQHRARRLAQALTSPHRRMVPARSPSGCDVNSPTKRKPLRAIVRISFCSSPLSPTARRAALIRLVNVESDTMRPPQTDAMRSSLLTTRSRFSTR